MLEAINAAAKHLFNTIVNTFLQLKVYTRKHVYEGVGILRPHSERGTEVTNTRQTIIHSKVGTSANHYRTQDFFRTY